MTIIVLLKHDLRLHDNPALWEASLASDDVIPVYILDRSQPWPPGGAQCCWLHHSLKSLSHSLAKKKIKLLLRQGNIEKIVQALVKKFKPTAIYWNRCYEPTFNLLEEKIKYSLAKKNISTKTFKANLLFEPWEVKNKQGKFYKVFTPFWRACLSQATVQETLEKPKLKQKSTFTSDELDDWALLPTQPAWSSSIEKTWAPGENAALKHLKQFIEDNLKNYKNGRDFPALDATSHLSPYLHFGEISPRLIYHTIRQHQALNAGQTNACEHFLRELGWREFSYHLLYHFPELPKKNFRPEFNEFQWKNNPKHLRAWQKGLTGYPIVDAGMRELWHTGYMHNRVRMITASFLIKDLLIDWRKGQSWFWDTLVDADLANNAASWQWVAGSGADAAPYFRIFNPVLQGEKFDPDSAYIKKWLPELSKLPKKYIHKPWEASNQVLNEAGLVLGINFPKPIVNHKICRQKALESYQAIKK